MLNIFLIYKTVAIKSCCWCFCVKKQRLLKNDVHTASVAKCNIHSSGQSFHNDELQCEEHGAAKGEFAKTSSNNGSDAKKNSQGYYG